jgi:hypothetical protein
LNKDSNTITFEATDFSHASISLEVYEDGSCVFFFGEGDVLTAYFLKNLLDLPLTDQQIMDHVHTEGILISPEIVMKLSPEWAVFNKKPKRKFVASIMSKVGSLSLQTAAKLLKKK